MRSRPGKERSAANRTMAKLTHEQRRALQLPRSPNGCTEAILMAHGLDPAILAKLVLDGLAKVDIHDAKVAGRGVKSPGCRSRPRSGRRLRNDPVMSARSGRASRLGPGCRLQPHHFPGWSLHAFSPPSGATFP
jgi:hypothetical protein